MVARPFDTLLTIQNTTTGEVDYLHFVGNTLAKSHLENYGLSWPIVADGDFNQDDRPDLVAQAPGAFGQLDFLFLDSDGKLISSWVTDVAVPHVVGEGFFGGTTNNFNAPNQVGPTLVS